MATSMSSASLYGSSTNKGFGGLVSGLDTDDLVKQMTARTRNKINRQYQAKQKLLYKQEAYRSISSKLLEFSNKYFSNSSTDLNVLNPSFFKASTIESSSKYVTISGNIDNIKNFSINSISSVATNSSFASTNIVSQHTFSSNDIKDITSTLAGETMNIEFKGKSYDIEISKTFGLGNAGLSLTDVVTELNTQLKKIDGNSELQLLKYKVDGNKIVFETGTAKLSGASTDIISVLNMSPGQAAASLADVTSSLTITKEEIFSNKDAYMTFDYNGIQKTISFSKMLEKKDDGTPKYTYDADGVSKMLQNELNAAYGTGKVTAVYNIGTKKISFEAAGTTNLFGVSSISKDLRCLTGIEPTTYNRINTTAAISKANLLNPPTSAELDLVSHKMGYSLSVNGKVFEFEETATLSDIMKKINSDADAGVNIFYSSTTDTFTVKSTITGSNSGVEIKDLKGTLAESLFGKSANSLLQPDEYIKNENGIQNIYKADGTKIGTVDYIKETSDYTINYDDGKGTDITGVSYVENKGTDTTMEYTLNGIKTQVTRSTAQFSVDGINVSLSEKAVGTATQESPINFTVTSNTKEVVERVKQFVTDYNEIIGLMYTKTSEKPNRDYQPLTPEQSDDMEKNEIENWTKEAKKGALFGDSKINTVLNGFRSAMSTKTSVSNLTLADIGISYASMDTSGKLSFDEEKFKKNLAQYADEMVDLFSGVSTEKNGISGLAVQVKSILKDNIGNYGSTGILVEEAGMDNSITSDRNNISEHIKDYNDKLSNLKKDLQKERDRYWRKFTELEKTMSKLNSQSSWFMNNMGS